MSDKSKQTKFGNVPDDWRYLRVEEFAKEVKSRNDGNKDIPVLSCTKHQGLVDSLTYFGKRIYSEDTLNYKIVSEGQFAYATNHIEEGSIGLLKGVASGMVSPMYTVFETDDEVNPSFLYKLFKTETYRHIFEISTNASVNRRGSLRWKQFAKLKVALPSIEEQNKIDRTLNQCTEEIDQLGSRMDQLKRQKIGLMQVLLTGKVRVNPNTSKGGAK